MAGRKPIPSRLKVLKGTQKPSRVNHNEPQPALGRPVLLFDFGAIDTKDAQQFSVSPITDERPPVHEMVMSGDLSGYNVSIESKTRTATTAPETS